MKKKQKNNLEEKKEKEDKQDEEGHVPRYRPEHGEYAMKRIFERPPPETLEEYSADSIVFTPGEDKGFEPDKLMVFLGKRRTGKSFTVRSLLGSYLPSLGYCLFEIFPAGLVITGTKLNQFWNKMFPKAYIHEHLSVLDKLFKYQTYFLEDWYKNPEINDPKKKTYINPYRVVVIDDMAGENELKYSAEINAVAVKGRHYKILVMLTTQYIKLVNTTMRENLDQLFLFYQGTRISKETIAEAFMSSVNKWEAMHYIDEHTQVKGKEREVLVWDNSILSQDLTKKLFLYKPEEQEDFLVGNRAAWQEESQKYDDFQKIRKKRRKRAQKKWEATHGVATEKTEEQKLYKVDKVLEIPKVLVNSFGKNQNANQYQGIARWQEEGYFNQ